MSELCKKDGAKDLNEEEEKKEEEEEVIKEEAITLIVPDVVNENLNEAELDVK